MTGHRADNPGGGNVWSLIWTVGGLFWAVVAIIEIVAFWHASGTMMDGEYVPTSPARGLSFILQFIVAACVYRVALAQGWPQGPYARARVIAIQSFLALAFVRCAPAAYYLAAAVVDGLTEELRDNLKHLQSFQWSYSDWAWALRLSVPRYALGLVLVALVKVAREYHRETLRSASLSMEYANTRLAMLSAQLQPHFLFNALHTIAELVDQNPARATTMLARLDASQFVRIHRSTIVNVEQIVELQPLFHGDCEVVLKRGTRLTMSRRFRSRMSPFFAGAWPA